MEERIIERVVANSVLMKEVAQELGLDLSTVKKVVHSQSEYTKNVMESGTFDSIRWPYLGVFKSKPKEVQMINHLRGMNPEQQREFKKLVRTGKLKFNYWEDELKKQKNAKNKNNREAPGAEADNSRGSSDVIGEGNTIHPPVPLS